MTRDDVYTLYEGIAFGYPQQMGEWTAAIVFGLFMIALSLFIGYIFSREKGVILFIFGLVIGSFFLLFDRPSLEVAKLQQVAYQEAMDRVLEEHIPTLDTVSYPVTAYALLSIEDVQEGDDVPVRATITRKGLPVETEAVVVVRFAEVEEPTLSYHVLGEDLVYGDYIPDEYVVRAGEYHPVLMLPKEENR